MVAEHLLLSLCGSCATNAFLAPPELSIVRFSLYLSRKLAFRFIRLGQKGDPSVCADRVVDRDSGRPGPPALDRASRRLPRRRDARSSRRQLGLAKRLEAVLECLHA